MRRVHKGDSKSDRRTPVTIAVELAYERMQLLNRAGKAELLQLDRELAHAQLAIAIEVPVREDGVACDGQ